MPHRLAIASTFLGSSRNFLYDGELSWSDTLPRDAWVGTGELKSGRCLDTLLRLEGTSLPHPPAPHLAAMGTLLSGSTAPVPWRHVLPKDVFRSFFNNVVGVLSAHYSDLSYDYAESAWAAGGRVLSALRPAKVDPGRWGELSAAGLPNAEGFRPNRSGYAAVPTYDRFGTRTGRMTITDGPNILLLKREARDVVRSSFPDGRVCSLDFRALEHRLVLAEAGISSDADDLYGDIAAEVLGGRASRDAVKTAVIAELYGVSRSVLRSRLGVPDDVLDSFIGGIRRHFGIEQLRARLKSGITGGRIRNRCGRPVSVPENRDDLLVNSYAQSSGVDVALQGFDEVLHRLGTDGVRPLFVLHDALILDVRADRLDDVAAVDRVEVSSYDKPFPLKFEHLDAKV